MTKVRVIYIERLDGEKNVIETELQLIGGIRAGIIRQVIKRKENGVSKTLVAEGKNKKIDKQDKKLLRRIKKMCDKETIVVANERVIRDFAISNTFFELKKKELLDNVARIIDYLWRQTGTDHRRIFLLIIESVKWKLDEIEELLDAVKNRYENIYIDNQTGIPDMENLAAFFYEEYGIVLHFVDGLQARQLKADTVVFLVKGWNEKYATITYCNAYMVVEFEEGQKRRRKRLHEELAKITDMNMERRNKEIYMGFAYSYCGKQIPYELAVAILYSEYLQHLCKQNVTKNEISIVAIYGVEWYN